ncbi:glycosyltransferase family 4 protein [Methanococcoides alaskense]|uniref:Glycosyltransferase involved in cell wall biosynthesis n=1 Tax=Methanococcoides alaskense TaxID=325778 RepID=A0AA90U0U7_9EURY|nr:glycosyltransferase family 4 protein [Methanococcoides alaskense]MDA0524407.1 glycosyltransferase family 4 protein [Methanococcoides alaskense]MDR6223224.1 glycosyltransferase involved in cell wall biosynthesis [Methanococcoides alaskense]
MAKKYKVLGLSSGGFKGFSGANYNLFDTISKRHELIGVIDNKLSGFWKYYNILYCFLKKPNINKYIHPIEEIYHGDVSYYRFRTPYYVLKRTKSANKSLKDMKSNCDLVLQTGWIPAILDIKDVPRFIYTDFTMKLAEREIPDWCDFLCAKHKEKWLELETKSYNNANVVFTLSNHTRRSIIDDYGVSDEKVVTVYAGTNLDDVPNVEKAYENKVILFVGIDFERKGGYVLLEAFKQVKAEIKDVRLIIIGSSPDINMEGVEVKGFVSHSEKTNYYNVASMFVMPSLTEPFGLVFLEAMAHRLPCIGSTVDAMPEIIINEETGYLVPPNNPDQLAEKIICLLKDESLMKRMGNSGRKKVEEFFTWDAVVERMTIEFEKINV